MKIVLFGKGGQLGWELQRALAPLGDVVAYGTADANFEQLDDLRRLVSRINPDVIINAAAYTAVDRAEAEADKAYRINSEAVGVLAEEAAHRNALLIHYSTDYVFNGEKPGSYTEDDTPAPLSIYGASKLAGEERIRQSGARHLLFRTSWVFAARGGNFARTMLRLAQERDELRVVADQYGTPTSAELIADVTALALHRQAALSGSGTQLSGTYHLAAAGRTTWHEYAQFVLQLAQERGVELKTTADRLEPISTGEYITAAQRPRNSCLDTTRLCNGFDLQLPDWRWHVRRMMDEITS